MPSATNKTFDNPQMNTNTLGTVEWFQPTMKKGGPPTIKNHTVTSYNGYLYCFGGYDGHRNHMSLLVYDIEEQKWMTVLSENEVDREIIDYHPRSHSSSNNEENIHNNNNYNSNHNHDGRLRPLNNHHSHRRMRAAHRNNNNDEDDGMYLRTQQQFSSRQNNRARQSQQSRRQQQQQHQPYSIGNPPAGRNGHTATLAKCHIDINNNSSNDGDERREKVCIFIIGGWLGSGPFAADDLHILDITNPQELIWVPPSTILRQQEEGQSTLYPNNNPNEINNHQDNNTTTTNEGNQHHHRSARVNANASSSIDRTINSPGPCNMHSADLIPNQNEIYVFRGGNGCEYLNELHALDVNRLTWRVVQTDGEIPQQRANHSSAYLEESCQLFIFGGWNGRERLNDIHILDTTTSTWTRPRIHGSLPHPRAGMSLTALRGKLYLFGGSGTSSKCFHDLHVLDPVEMTWLEVMQDMDQSNSSSSSNINNNSNNDEAKKGRSHHDNAHYDDTDWRGGHDLVDQHRFDSFTNRGDEYFLHSSNNMTNAANPNEIENEPCISIRGTGPGRRAGHSATAVDRFIYIFGGSCGSDYLSDFFVLDTDPAEYPQVTHPTSQQLVGRRLKYLCNKEDFADVVFVVDGQRIYAHKMVLALASDFYAAMFSVSNGFRETSSECPEIDVPNCSYDAFLCIMEYMYSGNDPNFDSCNIEQVVDILQMADQLLLDHLKQRCEQVLQDHVDESCVEYLLQVAQKTNALQLQSVCNHYIRNNFV